MPHLDASALTRDVDGVALLSAALGIPLPPAEVLSPTPRRGLQVLVVERDPLVRESISVALHARGHVVLEADTGERALATIRGGQAVDLLLAETETAAGPGGWALAQEARLRDPAVSVIYTGSQSLGPAEQALDSIVVEQPYRTGQILEAVQELTLRVRCRQNAEPHGRTGRSTPEFLQVA
jgi:CheY-like chemotaxis protein